MSDIISSIFSNILVSESGLEENIKLNSSDAPHFTAYPKIPFAHSPPNHLKKLPAPDFNKRLSELLMATRSKYRLPSSFSFSKSISFSDIDFSELFSEIDVLRFYIASM